MKTVYFLITIVITSTVIAFGQEKKGINDANGLKVGINAPVFKALDVDSNEFNLLEALESGPVVLIFYRGFWCPVCNKHLAQIQDSLKLITERGATVIAISPEKPEYLEKMADKSGAKFKLLYDEGYKIADAYDVTFTPSSSTALMYNTALGAKLKETHSDDSQRLPIPATYIIGSDGIIVWRQFDPNYKNRSTVDEILKNIPQ